MKRLINPIVVALILLVSCKEDDINLFEKTADERAAEAIAALKQDLIAPANGWLVKYAPQEGAGSYYVLMDFNETDQVIIKSDLGAGDGEYFQDTISYRIDNSLGLELILENYSFFSFLFEQEQATFGAEYEFNYVNKTPDNALVFQSKTDVGQPDIILFEEASAEDESLLGTGLATNLNTLAADLDKFTSSLKLTYYNKDLALYLSLDELRRTITVNAASLTSNTSSTQSVNFSTGYLVEGNKIIFDEPLQGTILGNVINITSLQFGDLSESTFSGCLEPIALHALTGTTSAGDNVIVETSLADVSGRSFAQLSNFYIAPLQNIFSNNTSAGAQIAADISGALAMQLYYVDEPGTDNDVYRMGIVIQNPNGSITWGLRDFSPVLIDNNLVFNFAPDITKSGADTDANISNVNTYLDLLASGDQTYVFQLQQHVYEFYNPCTGWSFVFINANQ